MPSQRPAVEVAVTWAGSTHPAYAEQLLGAEVARLTGLPRAQVRLTRSCPRCASSDHGRPVVLCAAGRRMPHVSLSRAGDLVVVAVCETAPVGVDVERLGGAGFAGFGDVALHPGETARTIRERTTTWVRKEALLKATGDALHLDPRSVRLSGPDQAPRLLEWPAASPPAPGVWLEDLEIPGHAASVCVLTDGVARVDLQPEGPEGPSR